MPEGEVLSGEASREINAEPNPYRTVDRYFCRLYYRSTRGARIRRYISRVRPLYQTGSRNSYNQGNLFLRLSAFVSRSHLEIARITKYSNFRSWISIRCRIHEGIE